MVIPTPELVWVIAGDSESGSKPASSIGSQVHWLLPAGSAKAPSCWPPCTVAMITEDPLNAIAGGPYPPRVGEADATSCSFHGPPPAACDQKYRSPWASVAAITFLEPAVAMLLVKLPPRSGRVRSP